jgi:hypothetical protein
LAGCGTLGIDLLPIPDSGAPHAKDDAGAHHEIDAGSANVDAGTDTVLDAGMASLMDAEVDSSTPKGSGGDAGTDASSNSSPDDAGVGGGSCTARTETYGAGSYTLAVGTCSSLTVKLWGGGGACGGTGATTQQGSGTTPYDATDLPAGEAVGGNHSTDCTKGGDGYAIVTYQ